MIFCFLVNQVQKISLLVIYYLTKSDSVIQRSGQSFLDEIKNIFTVFEGPSFSEKIKMMENSRHKL